MPSLLAFLASLSGPVWIILGIFGIGGLSAMVGTMFGARALLILLAGIAIVGALIAIYMLIIKARESKKAGEFGKDLDKQGAVTPQAVNRAEEMARLDDLRRKFAEGEEKFRIAGKNLYSIPWYLVVGESGSGKTEAIRRSGIGFPPGLQDEMQGVGGTVNMNWWFSNHAVLLDVAGRISCPDVASTGSSEWTKFLELLKRSRTNCPINGLMLVIPANSLIEDDVAKVQEKAARLQKQLDKIQRALDVRFPVFVVISKSDLINGFREMFDDLDSQQAQQQILGWSNQMPVDSPLSFDHVAEYLEALRFRLIQKRLQGLGQIDPETTTTPGMRLDMVDTLFDLPASFASIYENLRLYLEGIFMPSDWAPKPLFVRGIYFTSSMREGAALDKRIADVLGLAPEQLPEGKMWEKDKAFFLRDLFTQKIFREWGLVTRATDIRRSQRMRSAVLMGSAAAALLVLIGGSLISGLSFKQGIGDELVIWKRVEKELAKAKRPLDCTLSIVQRGKGGSFEYKGSLPLEFPAGGDTTIADMHKTVLHKLKNTTLRSPLAFRVFSGGLQPKRESAYGVWYDFTVLRPATAVARSVLDHTDKWKDGLEAPLLQLIKVEADAGFVEFSASPDPDPLDLRALLAAIQVSPADESLAIFQDGIKFRYGKKPSSLPKWLATRRPALIDNYPIDRGVRKLIDYAGEKSGATNLIEFVKSVNRLQSLLDQSEQSYADCEKRKAGLVSWLQVNNSRLLQLKELPALSREWKEMRESCDTAFASYEQKMIDVTNGLASLSTLSVQGEFSNLQAKVVSDFENTFPKQLRTPPASSKNIVAEVVSTVLLAIDAVRNSQSSIELKRMLARFEEQYRENKNRIALVRPLRDLPRLPVKESLGDPLNLAWADLREAVVDPQVAEQHNVEIANVGTNVGKFVDALSRSLPPEAITNVSDTLVAIKAMIAKGNDEPFEMRVGWQRLDYTNALANRFPLLKLKPEKMRQDYFVDIKPGQKTLTYHEQYWRQIYRDGFGVLVTQCVREVTTAMERLEKYKKFPLDKNSASDMSPDELLLANRDLAMLNMPVFPEGTVGSGSTLVEAKMADAKFLDPLIEQLRTAGEDTYRKWINDAQKFAGFLPPVNGQAAITFKVRVIEKDGQDTLLDELSNRKSENRPYLQVRGLRFSGAVNGKAGKVAIRTDRDFENKASEATIAVPSSGTLRIEFLDNNQFLNDNLGNLDKIEFDGNWAMLHLLATSKIASKSPNAFDVELLGPKLHPIWVRVDVPNGFPLPEKDWPVFPSPGQPTRQP